MVKGFKFIADNGAQTTITAEVLIEWLVDYTQHQETIAKNDNNLVPQENQIKLTALSYKMLPLSPRAWLREALTLKQGDIPTKLEDVRLNINSFIEAERKVGGKLGKIESLEKFCTRKLNIELNEKRAKLAAKDRELENLHPTIRRDKEAEGLRNKVKADIHDIKNGIQKIENIKKTIEESILQEDLAGHKKDYYDYFFDLIKNDSQNAVYASRKPSELNLYKIGERIISIANPGFRYADRWGSLDDILNTVERLNKNIKKSPHISETEANSPPPAQNIADESDLAIKTTCIMIDRRLNLETRISTRKRLLTEGLREEYEHYVKEKGGLSYPELIELIRDEYSDQKNGEKEVINEIRDLLVNSNTSLSTTFPATIAAVWFLAEVSRSPTCMLSGLMLLDLIENGWYKNHSWERLLWGKDDNGGVHPMCHDGSYHPHHTGGSIWSPLPYKIDDPLQPSRQKEADVIVRWLKYLLGNQIVPIESAADLNQAGDQASQKAFLDRNIKIYFDQRMQNFDLMKPVHKPAAAPAKNPVASASALPSSSDNSQTAQGSVSKVNTSAMQRGTSSSNEHASPSSAFTANSQTTGAPPPDKPIALEVPFDKTEKTVQVPLPTRSATNNFTPNPKF